MFENFRENTGYRCIPENLYDEKQPCATTVLMYAVFCDERAWRYASDSNNDESDDDTYLEQAGNSSRPRHGYAKTVRFGGVVKTVWYLSGVHLDVCGSSYGSRTRALIGDYIA